MLQLRGSLVTRRVSFRDGTEAVQNETRNYWIDFVEKGPSLVILFDNSGIGNQGTGDRPVWGQTYVLSRGYSVIGIKPKESDWYRGKDLHQIFLDPAFNDFVKRFLTVTLYGTSMGGYAALAFSRCFPGAVVVAHAPQTTLDERIVPWEKRFGVGRRQDWSGDFRDASEALEKCRRIYVTYDPFYEPDRRHADRISGPNVMALRMPFLGHLIPQSLNDIRVLKRFTDLALAGELDTATSSQLIRARRNSCEYYLNLYRKSRNGEVRIFAMKRAEDINPLHGEVLRFKIFEAFQLKRVADCVTLHERNPDLTGLGPAQQTETNLVVALCMHRLGKTEHGRKLVEKVLASSFRGPRALALIADFYREAGDYALSERYANDAIKSAPAFGAGYRALAEVQIASAELGAAIETLKLRLATIGPDRACEEWISRLSRRLLAQGGFG